MPDHEKVFEEFKLELLEGVSDDEKVINALSLLLDDIYEDLSANPPEGPGLIDIPHLEKCN